MTSSEIFEGLEDGQSVRITRIRGALVLENVGERFRDVRLLRLADLETDPDLIAWTIATAGKKTPRMAGAAR